MKIYGKTDSLVSSNLTHKHRLRSFQHISTIRLAIFRQYRNLYVNQQFLVDYISSSDPFMYTIPIHKPNMTKES